jgi:DNA-directed RNA polymerase specialized sigma24 family protein
MKASDYEDAVCQFHEGMNAFGYGLTRNEGDASELTQETSYRLLTSGVTIRHSYEWFY